MTTVQLVGIAVASAVVVLLVIALLVTRRRDSHHEEEPPQPSSGSVLGEVPQSSLDRLGKAVQPVEDVTIDPGALRDVPTQPSAPAEHTDDSLSPAPPPTHAATPTPAVAQPPAEAKAAPAAPRPAAAAGAGAGASTMPLSDIIVTTSNKMVDLQDPEVRRMLTDLVTFEIDQATQLRQQGQTIDAVLQLTEAEKISRALGMHESAQRIHEMMYEMRGQT